LLDFDASKGVVFVTAYDDYAVQAFELSAMDYLLKPVTAQRLSKTFDKIIKRHRSVAARPKWSFSLKRWMRSCQGNTN
jgi:two-component system LytT family response regulator